MDHLQQNLKKQRRNTAKSARASARGNALSFSFLKLAITTGVVLFFAVIFFVFNTFGETKINITLNSNPSLNDGLVGHWTFDGPDLLQNVADTSGNGNTGYLTNFTSTTTVPGKIGQALSFDGVNDYVSIGAPSITTPSSVCIWVEPYSTLGIKSPFDGVGLANIDMYRNSGGEYYFWGSNTDETRTRLNSGVLAAVNTWDYICLVFKVGARQFFVNGDIVASDSKTSKSVQYDLIGTGSNITGYAWDGAIDDVRLYNRALSATEVKRLYQQGATTYVNKSLTTNPSLNDGLVGHWTFDGPDLLQNVADTSGNGNTGYLTNFTSTTTVPGKIGQALSFDGVDDAIIIPDNNSLDSNTTLSLSAWVFFDGSGGNYQFIAGKRNGFSYSYAMQRSAGKVGFLATSGGFTGSTFPSGRWAHIVLTYDSGSGSIYLDGVLDATSTGMTITNSAIDFSIGNEINSTIPFGGKIDDVRLYNRALSATEVKRLYQQGATTYINKTLTTNPSLNDGLVGHWTFDGPDLLQNVADSSGNGSTGYLTGYSTNFATTTSIGAIGQALDFDGVDDYIDLGYPAALELTSSFTIAAWIKPTAGDCCNWIFSRGDESFTNARNQYEVYYSYADAGGGAAQDHPDVAFSVGDGTTYEQFLYSGANLVVGQWSFVVCRLSDSNEMQCFVNGEAIGTPFIKTITPTNTTDHTLIGAGKKNGGFAAGSIDDVRVYNRALSADEIKKLYELGN